ncbi:MAG: protein kinase [Gemmatimonadetes bacterium]|nr:protein kinase [Gemmatimonadota bacterium]
MFCPDCGTWNRSAARTCGQCGLVLPQIPVAIDAPDHLITSLRQATGQRYRIVRRVGSGGMADVYEARHHMLDRPLAVKVLHSHLSREPEMRVRFKREAEAASRLLHPFICSPLDYGETDDAVYIVLPFISGGCLADDLAKTRTIEAPRAARIAAQVATALDYATRQGIIHRDVKPDNVLFDADGNAILTDFGIATAHFHGRLTAGGRAMGTPHYMAPEQAMGRFVDGRADLYAVGVMLYECLLGATPFDGPDGYAIGYKHVHEMPTPIERVAPHISRGLAAITMRCLEKAPEKRFQRGHDLAEAIYDWMGTEGVHDAPPVRGSRPAE